MPSLVEGIRREPYTFVGKGAPEYLEAPTEYKKKFVQKAELPLEPAGLPYQITHIGAWWLTY